MMNNKMLLVILIILLSSNFNGCLNKSSYIGYSIYVTPTQGSETILIVPLVMDKNSGEIASVMNVKPKFSKGNADLEIINTDKGPAMKIITNEEIVVRFTKDYKENGAELRQNRILSMTNTTHDEIATSWAYFNSTKNQTTFFWITLRAGDDKKQLFEISGRNISNGWNQFNVKKGIEIV
ncbi:MAG: hypothetical protein SCH39_02575 [Methanosarcinales archaeon]|nr:hypothetical protein [Methanosarcinales archaeon]